MERRENGEPAFMLAKRITAIVLLLFNGITACFGGWMMMTDPTGSRLQMPVGWLQHSPFSTYLVPGIILFIFLGLSSIAIAVFTLVKARNYPLFLVFQGLVIIIWIITQMIMIRMYHPLHLIYGGIGLALVVLGMLLRGTIRQLL